MSLNTSYQRIGGYYYLQDALDRMAGRGFILSRTDLRLLYFLAECDGPSGYGAFEHTARLNAHQIRQGLAGLLSYDLIDKADRKYARYSISINGRAFLKRMDDTLKKLIKDAS